MASGSNYILSATLQGHESDVKALVFPNSNTIASVSRDGSSRLWKSTSKDSEGSNLWPSQILYHDTPYLNSVTWLESDDHSMFVFLFHSIPKYILTVIKASLSLEIRKGQYLRIWQLKKTVPTKQLILYIIFLVMSRMFVPWIPSMELS